MKLKFMLLGLVVLFMFSFSFSFASDGSCLVSSNIGIKNNDIQTNGDVTHLQNFLVSNGYLAGGNITGYFGTLTLAAVTQFQSAKGLETTGFVGPLTRVKISEIGCGTGEVLGASTDTKSSQNNRIEVTLTTDKDSYHRGDSVVLTYAIKNNGNTSLIYNFSSGCQVAVEGPFENDTLCSYALTSFSISAGQTKTFNLTKKIKTDTAPEKYDISAQLIGYAQTEESHRIKVNATTTPHQDYKIDTKLTTNKNSYYTGESAVLTYSISNKANNSITYNFNSGCQTEVVGPFEEDGVICSSVLSSLTIPARTTKNFILTKFLKGNENKNSQEVAVQLVGYEDTVALTHIKTTATSTRNVTTNTHRALFNRNLTIGSTGSDVIALQDILITKGYLVMPTGVSKGYFGLSTLAGVIKLQKAAGISPAVGYVGSVTRAYLETL